VNNRPGQATIRKALKTRCAADIAEELGVHVSHVYNVEQRGVSPTLHQALLRAGWLRRRTSTSVRLAASVTAEQRARLHALAAERGMTWSEYCRALADEEMLRRDDDE
jgi:hypothetical protein